jgi:small-conductance mechanosensitive channel
VVSGVPPLLPVLGEARSGLGDTAAAVVAVTAPFDALDARLRSQLLASVALVAVLVVLWFLVVHGITRRVDDATVWYQARKVASYVGAVLTILGLLWIWVGALRQLGTFLGLLSAGVAIALSDLLKNVAGWLYILVRRPFRVDDRIEIGEVRGDVIDIRVFRTTLLEIGNWVDADQSTGRIVHIPNGKVLTEEVYNATEGFGYVWHEIPVVITFESDWRRAEELVLEALLAVGGGTSEEAAIRIRRASRAYKIRYTHLTPTVYLTVRQSGVLLTGRLLVDTRRRRTVEQQIWRHLLEAFEAEPTIELAYPTTRFYTAAEVQAGKAAAVARTDERDDRPDDLPIPRPPTGPTDGGGRSGGPGGPARTHDARDVPRG